MSELKVNRILGILSKEWEEKIGWSFIWNDNQGEVFRGWTIPAYFLEVKPEKTTPQTFVLGLSNDLKQEVEKRLLKPKPELSEYYPAITSKQWLKEKADAWISLFLFAEWMEETSLIGDLEKVAPTKVFPDWEWKLIELEKAIKSLEPKPIIYPPKTIVKPKPHEPTPRNKNLEVQGRPNYKHDQPIERQCGAVHYSWSDYWAHRSAHNPDWKEKECEPWKQVPLYHGTAIGVLKTVNVCIYCNGVEEHQTGCNVLNPDWFSPVVSSTSPTDIVGSFHNPFGGGGGFQMPPLGKEQEEEERKAMESKIEIERKRQEKEKKDLEKINKKFEFWEKDWVQYLEDGKGIEYTHEWKKIGTDGAEIKQEWNRPIILEMIIDNVEIPSGYPDVRLLNLTDCFYQEKGKPKPTKIKQIAVNVGLTCEKDAFKIGGSYYSLIDVVAPKRKLQLFLEEDTELNFEVLKSDGSAWIDGTDALGSKTSNHFLGLDTVYFDLRQYKWIRNLSWNGYWQAVQKEYKDLPTADGKLRRKLENIREKFQRNEEADISRKRLLLEKIDAILFDIPLKGVKGFFDELYDMNFSVKQRKELKELVIDMSSFKTASQEIPFKKFQYINQGQIILNDFPELEKITIQELNGFSTKLTIPFVKIDISKTAPNLKRLVLSKCQKLVEIVLGKKAELNHLDVRWTDLKGLDLTQTKIKLSDLSTPVLPATDIDIGTGVEVPKVQKPFDDDNFVKNKILWGTIPK